MYPDAYKPATWRGTLPVEKATKTMGVCFNTEDEGVIRLGIPVESARKLSESIADYLTIYDQKQSHSEMSQGISSVSGSMPEDGKKV